MMYATEKFYDRIALLYPLIDIFLKPQKRLLFQKVNTYPHGQVLEVGIGNGTHFQYYKTHDIVGIDTSRQMLALAQKNIRDNIKLFKMDGTALQFGNNHFDYVILSHVITVVESPERLLDEVYRVLRPGGRLFILNHATPNNFLKYFDKTFQTFSRLLHFNSMFPISAIMQATKFRLVEESNTGLFSYFKILVYEKSI